MSEKCHIPACTRSNHWAGQKGEDPYRGLCLPCYSKAKALVESGDTTWERFEQLGLCLPYKMDPFTEAYYKAEGA